MRILPSPRLLAALALLAAAPRPLAAQQTNLFGSLGGFEHSTLQDNLWDGVNGNGYLAGFTHTAQIVTERGSFSALAMPPSVAFVDLNGDGKPDLVTADPSGFLRFYPNSGTPTAPKFTSAEVIPFFLSPSQAGTSRQGRWRTTKPGFVHASRWRTGGTRVCSTS